MIMRTLEVNDSYVLSKLDLIEDRLLNLNHSDLEINFEHTSNNLDSKDEKLSENYLHDIINRGRMHDGYPEFQPSYESKSLGDKIDSGIHQYTIDLVEYMFSQRKCLGVLYPPKSYCSWHNNANAAGYGLMFSWSATGEGDFRYWDLDKKEVVVIPDKKGWNVKTFYFGNYDYPEKLIYHASSNNCLRYSMGFNFLEEETTWEDTNKMLENNE